MATTVEQVRSAFGRLAEFRGGAYDGIDLFTRLSVTAATGEQICLTKKTLARLVERLRVLSDNEDACRESHNRAVAALRELQNTQDQRGAQDSSPCQRHDLDAQIAALQKECTTRHYRLVAAQQEHETTRKQERQISERLRDKQAFLAQSELLKFVLSQRYSLTPLNFATAMAGLPDIGWRQSFKRCEGSKPPQNANSIPYRQFNIITAALSDTNQGADSPAERIHEFLQQKKKRNDIAASELKKNWYYLRQAVEKVVAEPHSADSLPYRISAEYQRRITSRTALDLLREEEERLS